MFQRITARKAGQWSAGLFLLGISTAATFVSGWINVHNGLQINTTTAIIFGLSDAALFAIPIAIVTMGWSWPLRIMLAICAMASVWNAGNFLFDGQWQRFMTVEEQIEGRSELKKQRDRLQSQLAAITEASTVDALDRQIKAKRAEADSEANAGGCGTQCRKDLNELAKLEDRKGKAERRDTLQVRLDNVRGRLKSLNGSEDVVTSMPLGEWRVLFTVVLTLLLLETLRHMSGYAWHLLRLAAKKPQHKKKREPEIAGPAPASGNIVPLNVDRTTRALESLTGVRKR